MEKRNLKVDFYYLSTFYSLVDMRRNTFILVQHAHSGIDIWPLGLYYTCHSALYRESFSAIRMTAFVREKSFSAGGTFGQKVSWDSTFNFILILSYIFKDRMCHSLFT